MIKMRKAIALVLALMLAMSFAAIAEKETVSDSFTLPPVIERPTEPTPGPAVTAEISACSWLMKVPSSRRA